jgi:hypothetical protein
MNALDRIFIALAITIAGFSNAHAAPTFGAMASGSELDTPGILTDGGAGSSSASISSGNYGADASFVANSTYLPELTAFAINPSIDNDDDRTFGHAEAYQVFNNTGTGPINLNISLHGIIDDGVGTDSYVLADIWVYGGSDFEVVTGSQCSDGSFRSRYLFDSTYFCGSRLQSANLYIDSDGETTLLNLLTFDPGASFGVYGILRTNAKGGTSDATQTLALNFENDDFISAVNIPPMPPLPTTVPSPAPIWLFGTAMIGWVGFSKRKSKVSA